MIQYYEDKRTTNTTETKRLDRIELVESEEHQIVLNRGYAFLKCIYATNVRVCQLLVWLKRLKITKTKAY